MNPVIGIVGVSNHKYDHNYYISSAYVGWLRTHGCRIIAINPIWNHTTLEKVIKYTDGILFQGAENHPYPDDPVFRTISHILEIVVSEKYGKIPVYGICNGLQSIATYFSNIPWDTLKTFVANIHSTSKTHYTPHRPNVFKSLLDNTNTVIPLNYNHKYVVSTNTFNNSKRLTDNFNVLASSFSKSKKYKHIEFVSCMRHRNLPIFASMFHPEKANNEWSPSQSFINRSIPTVMTSENICAFFVELCRLYRIERNHPQSGWNNKILDKYDVSGLELTYVKPCMFDDPMVRVYLRKM